MADKNKKSKTDKVLGQDPFEGMFGLEQEESDLEDSIQSETTTAELGVKTGNGQTIEPPIPAEEFEPDPKPTPEATTDPKPALPVLSQTEESIAEGSSHLLDELIATIDEEIERAFGSNIMVNLDAKAWTDRSDGTEQFVIFTLAGTEYAAPAANVREVGEIVNLTPVPNVPDWLLGLTNLRGDILSVVDLRAFLGLEQTGYAESLLQDEISLGREREILVIHPREDASLMTTGLVVDEVNDIRYLTVDQISAPAAPIKDQIGPYLRGVYEHEEGLLVVLDFDKLLLSPDMRQFEAV